MTKVEFGSREWVVELRRILHEGVRTQDLTDVTFSMCEEFTDPPAHLQRDGSSSIGWQLRITNGEVEVIDGPASDVDIHIVTDYEFILPTARTTVGDDPAEQQRNMIELLQSGKFRIEGTPGNGPAWLPALNLHDKLALITR